MEKQEVNNQEFIQRLKENLDIIRNLYHKFNPDGTYLTLTMVQNTWQVNNEFWNKDANFPIDYSE